MRHLTFILLAITAIGLRAAGSVPQWGVYERAFSCAGADDPFAGGLLTAIFIHEAGDSLRVEGFYDGSDTYRIRFMPGRQGLWSWRTSSPLPALDGHTGQLLCTPPAPGCHGIVRVGTDRDFVYADSTPCRPVGTTSYACLYGDDALRARTVETLRSTGFNKLRFAVFPNSSVRQEPDVLPYAMAGREESGRVVEADSLNIAPVVGAVSSVWDPDCFDPAYFRRLEAFIQELSEAGVQADLILFHPYDGGRWGFDRMDMDANLRYLRYVVARLGAYHNMWWSLANEWNLLRARSEDDWLEMTRYVARIDPYGHLRSVHGTTATYTDYHQPCYTHASVQDQGPLWSPQGAATVRCIFPKPVVFDEVCYEGDHERRWGQLSGREMLHRMYTALMGGSYPGHGECFVEAPDYYTGRSFLALGGEMRGESAKRIRFMLDLLESLPEMPRLADVSYDLVTAGCGDGVYLVYLGLDAPENWTFSLPVKNDRFRPLRAGDRFAVEIIDTWEMTSERCPEVFEAAGAPARRVVDAQGRSVALPGRPGMLLKITRVE